MANPSHGSRSGEYFRWFHRIIVALAVLLLLPGRAGLAQTDDAARIPDVQLDSLVAPIALYPDPLLSQVLVASTYPLEIVQLRQFLQTNPHLKDRALGDGVELKPWDPSIKAMASFPDVVKRMSDGIRWTTDLGNAFLAQESGVLDAIQRMRARAVEKGTLESVEQQIVGTETGEEGQLIITIEPADPETVYVPIYDPTLAYGEIPYPYPPIYYPPPGYYSGKALVFAVAVALGRAWNGGWGYACAWRSRDITINRNNRYVRNSPKHFDVAPARANKWQHSPAHRGGAPYSTRQLTERYSNSAGNAGGGDRLDNRRTAPNVQRQLRDRPAPAPVTSPRPRPTGADRIGNQAPSFGNTGAFDGGNRDFTRASSNRGATSMGGSHGGGARGGGRRR